jgi:hypothetical protein
MKLVWILLIIVSVLMVGCLNDERSCSSLITPTVNVNCQEMGVYQEFNVETGRNEYKPRYYCYAYISGEQGIIYRVVDKDNLWGEIGAGGNVEVPPIGIEYIEVYPNLDGVFCKNKSTIVPYDQFVGLPD